MKRTALTIFPILTILLSSLQAQQTNVVWSDEFFLPGLNGSVLLIESTTDGTVYAGGDFTETTDGLAVSYIAQWDGTNWSPLGQGLDDYPWSMTVDQAGNLYVAGYFTVNDDPSIRNMAKWDGSAWQRIGNDYISSTIRAIEVDTAGNIYIGGSFTYIGQAQIRGIAKWDGNSWSGLGGGVNSGVTELAVKGDTVYAGGDFTTAGDSTVRRIAMWDGTTWSSMGGGANGLITDIAIGNSGEVYVSGTFDSTGNVETKDIAKWDGNSWSALGTGLGYAHHAIGDIEIGPGDTLYIGGYFSSISGVSATGFAIWDGSQWVSSGSTIYSTVSTVDLAVDGSIYIGGGITSIDNLGLGYIARWDESGWHPLAINQGKGLSDYVWTLMSDGTDLYAGGSFRASGDGQLLNRIGRYDGSQWHPLGSGMESGIVYALAKDSSGNIIAGGYFSTVGGVTAYNIAVWDGSSWSDLGVGLNNDVFAIGVAPNGDIYAGGTFYSAGGQSANNIAVWDGETWSNLGTGTNGKVWDIAIDDSGNVFIAGDFVTVDGITVNHIARWDGTQWHALGNGMHIVGSGKWDLEIGPDQRLYVTGIFDQAGWVAADRIAVWDGTEWGIVGANNDFQGRSIAFDNNGVLLALGDYSETGFFLKRLENDGSWTTLAPDVRLSYDMVVYDGKLYVGGDDTNVDGTLASFYIGEGTFNSGPLALDDTVTTPEDTAVTFAALANDTDPDGDNLTLLSLDIPANGTSSLGVADSIIYTPATDYFGPDSFSYVISDGSLQDTGKIIIHVTAVNDAPVAADDHIEGYEDEILTILALQNDSDIDDPVLSILSVSGAQHGSVVINGNDTLIYTPDANWFGLDTLSYMVADTLTATDSAHIFITISSVNDRPVAVDDTTATDEDVSCTYNPLVNDSDLEGNELFLGQIVGDPLGTAYRLNDTTFRYIPPPNFFGWDTVVYGMYDNQGGLDTASVFIEVRPVNDAPFAVNDAATCLEDSNVVIQVLLNDSDIDGDTLRVSWVGTPYMGTAEIIQGDSAVLLTPGPNFNGILNFNYTITDGHGGETTAMIQATVTPVNDGIVANTDWVFSYEDSIVDIPVLLNDYNFENDGLLLISFGEPWHGETSFIISDSTQVRYTPDPDFFGADSFYYIAADTNGAIDSATVYLTLYNVNDPPVAVDDTLSIPEDSLAICYVLANDTDIDSDLSSLSSTLLSGPEHGSAHLVELYGVHYQPEPDYVGHDTITYICLDGALGDTAQILITVTPVNDPPAFIAALPDTGFAEDDTLFIPYSRWHALVEDPDHPDTLLMWNFFGNDPISVTHDTFGICFRAPQDWYGADSLWVVASDGSLSDTTSLVLTVIPVNDAPLPFALLEPSDDSTIVITPESIDDTLMFRWEQALDVDSDSVWYGCVVMGHLALVLPGDTSLAVDSLLLTGYQAFVDTVLAWGDSIITGTWTIFATDGMDTTWALGEGEYFTLTIKISAELLALLAADLLPTEFALHQNYPNPFNPSTTIRFDLPVATDLHMVVYDLLGREVVRLVDQRLEAGYHQLVWNGRDRTGRELPTGMYIVLMVTPEYSKSIKLVLLK